jgi:class 3 adenylate cyclase
MEDETTRKIVAIMFSDIAGYTAAMGQDEELAIRAVSRARTVQKELVRKFHGDWVQEVGDGALCTFASAVEAVTCALEIQRAFEGETDFQLRIGIHVGDIVFRKTEVGYDVFGDGVNVAARVQGVSEVGGICISERVYDDLRNRKLIEVRYLGEHQLKNVNRPIGIYAVIDPQRPGVGAGAGSEAAVPAAPAARKRSGWPIGVVGALALAGIAALAWSLQGRTPEAPSSPKALHAPAQPEPERQPARAEPIALAPAAQPSEVSPVSPVAPPVAPPVVAPAPVVAAVKPPAGLAFDAVRRALLARVGPYAEAHARVETDPNPVPNDEKYQVVFEAQCDCEAMLFAIDGSKDEIALLYPNPYDPPRRLVPGEQRRLPGTDAYAFRAVGGEGVDMLKLFVTPREFSFPPANINAWAASPSRPERLGELARWLDSLEKIPFATSVTPLQIRR